MRQLSSFWKSDKPSRRQHQSCGLGINLENCEERMLLSGVAIYPAQAAEVESVESTEKVPKKVKFRIGVSNSSEVTMYISLTSQVGTQSAQYTVKPMSDKSFECKLPTQNKPYLPRAEVWVSIDSGNLTRMNEISFRDLPGQAAVDQHQMGFDFSLAQLDVAEWADGFVWSCNPRHK